MCVYKDVANDIVYGFLNTLSSGINRGEFIDPSSITQSGDGTDPNPLTPIQLIGRIGSIYGRNMGIRGLNPANGNIDYPSFVGLRYDGYYEPIRRIPVTGYTSGDFVPGEVLTGVMQDGELGPGIPAIGSVRSQCLFIGDSTPISGDAMGVERILVYPIHAFNVQPWWRVPAGKDTEFNMNMGEVLTGSIGANSVTVVDGYVPGANIEDAATPWPSWAYDNNDPDTGVVDPTKALGRGFYFKSLANSDEFFDSRENNWRQPDSHVQESLSWYAANATPVRYFSTRTIDSAEGLVSSTLRSADRSVLGVGAVPLNESWSLFSPQGWYNSSAVINLGLNHEVRNDWETADERITDTKVQIIDLDVEVEAHPDNEPLNYGDIIVEWKLESEGAYRVFNIDTWFAESAAIPAGTILDVKVLRYNSADESFSAETVVKRVLLDSTQNRRHSL
jgi:hypothetical protein